VGFFFLSPGGGEKGERKEQEKTLPPTASLLPPPPLLLLPLSRSGLVTRTGGRKGSKEVELPIEGRRGKGKEGRSSVLAHFYPPVLLRMERQKGGRKIRSVDMRTEGGEEKGGKKIRRSISWSPPFLFNSYERAEVDHTGRGEEKREEKREEVLTKLNSTPLRKRKKPRR